MARVLIVDDDPQTRAVLASDLEHDKHVVSQAGGVAAARRAIAVNRYEAILTAQILPDGTGLDVLGAARDTDANVSLIVLSQVVTPDLVLEGLRKDFFDFLAKTSPPETLRAAVGRACDRTTPRGRISRIAGKELRDARVVEGVIDRQPANPGKPSNVDGEAHGGDVDPGARTRAHGCRG